MGNPVNKYEGVLQLTRELPIQMQLQLIEVLSEEIYQGIGDDINPSLIVTENDLKAWRGEGTKTGKEIAESNLPPAYEHVSDSAALVRQWRRTNRP